MLLKARKHFLKDKRRNDWLSGSTGELFYSLNMHSSNTRHVPSRISGAFLKYISATLFEQKLLMSVPSLHVEFKEQVEKMHMNYN